MTPSTWNDVVATLTQYPWRTPMQIPKGMLPHPQAVGMKLSGGMPQGQLADYRYVLDEGIGFHVKDFGQHYEAHLDEVHPEVNFVEHLRQDAPEVYVGGAAALGAALGGLLGRSWKAALAGAAIAGALSAWLAVDAKQDDEARKSR